jgi:hypothetical protein
MEIASCKPLYAVLAALIGSILVSMAGRNEMHGFRYPARLERHLPG